MELRVSILGGGSWGTTVASLVARNTQALLWARNADTVAEINEAHSNSRYLPGARLSPKLTATSDFEEAVSTADLLVVAFLPKKFRTRSWGEGKTITRVCRSPDVRKEYRETPRRLRAKSYGS